MYYSQMSQAELKKIREGLQKEYQNLKDEKLALDLSRGKPGREQLDLMTDMLTCISCVDD